LHSSTAIEGAPASAAKNAALPEEDREFLPIWEACRPYTMTSFARGLALFRAVRYIATRPVPGSIVECGVWRGGSSMIALMSLLKFGDGKRRVVLFDTYQGMTEPGEFDVDREGRSAKALLEAEKDRAEQSLVWAKASLDEVRANLASTGYDMSLVEFVDGDVRTTLSRSLTGAIALLRLDTDFYDSTMAELKVLYPRLLQHGVLLIDDYDTAGVQAGGRRVLSTGDG
jgi:hypothetical protein